MKIVLVGEHLMRQADPGAALGELLGTSGRAAPAGGGPKGGAGTGGEVEVKPD